MRAFATAFLVLLGPASMMAQGRSEMDILRARCTEQERQIRTLEKEIEGLHSQLALERRRSRGIEPSAAPASALPPAPLTSYTVTTGDTLSSIARRYRTTTAALMQHNGIDDPTRLRVGQKLTLPAEAKSPQAVSDPGPNPQLQVAETPATTPNPAPQATVQGAKSTNYTVQRGDTLYGIARRYQMDIASLRSLNPKLEDKILVGQTITVTGEPKKEAAVSLGSSKTLTIATTPSASKPAAASKAASQKPAPEVQTKAASRTTVAKDSPSPKPDAKPTPLEDKKKQPAQSSPLAKSEEQSGTPASTSDKETAPAPAPQTISSIIVMDEISFGDFAAKHGTTPQQLNALNGWDFQSSLVLARGSEIYVPGR